MSGWRIGKSKPKNTLAADEQSGRSTTPTPGNPDGVDERRRRGGQISFRCVSSVLLTSLLADQFFFFLFKNDLFAYSVVIAPHSVMGAEGLSLPADTPVPPAVQAALTSSQAKLAESISPSSVTQQRLAHKSRGSRESVQRIGLWYLPYLVVEYEVNQTVITPVGGGISKPTYAYPAHLCVFESLGYVLLVT